MLENTEKCGSDIIMFSYHPKAGNRAQLMYCARSSIWNIQTPRCGLLKFTVTVGEDIRK